MQQLTPDQLQALKEYATRTLGLSADDWERLTSTGQTDALSGKINAATLQRAAEVLQNPAQVERLMASPAVQALLRSLQGGN